MSKRKRSQFEPIPTEGYQAERLLGRLNQGPNNPVAGWDRAGIQAWQRWNRRSYRLNRTIDSQVPAQHMFNSTSLYWKLAERVRTQLLWRSFGLQTNWDFDRGIRAYDRERFFESTGRLGFVIQKWQEAIDRRRKEAYIRLRSWLPMEVVRRILQLTPTGVGMYGSVSGRFVVGAPRELLN